MDATPYIVRIRRVLQDYTSPARAGVFWSDYFIKLVLNTSQDIIVNYLLRTGKKALLERLVSTFTFSGTGPTVLPADYLHFISATVSATNKTARVYIGGEGYTYLYTVHDAVVILNNAIWFVDRGDVTGTGSLHYYRRPNPILLPADSGYTTTQDFDAAVYDLITRYASSLLGVKTTVTSRDVRNRQRVSGDAARELRNPVHYPIDRDMREQ